MTRTPSNGATTEPGERTSLLAHEGQHSDHTGGGVWQRWPRYVVHLTWKTLVRDYINLLLVFVPLGIVAGELHWNASAVFALNFVAIIPLASLLGFATEELSATMGQTLGGLMNATFGNAVELIVGSLIPFGLDCANDRHVDFNCGSPGPTDKDHSSQYDRFCAIEHAARSRLLLFGRRTQVPRAEV